MQVEQALVDHLPLALNPDEIPFLVDVALACVGDAVSERVSINPCLFACCSLQYEVCSSE